MAELIIVGVGRSGTSLLQSMLAAHPEIAMLPETGFFRRYCAAPRPIGGRRDGGGHDSGSAHSLRRLRSEDGRLRRLSEESWKAALSRLPERAESGLNGRRSAGRAEQRRRLVRLYQALLLPAVAGLQAERVPERLRYTADKDPRLIEYLPLLRALFPESHVIHIVRDPRDVLLSKSAAEWSRHRNWRSNLAAGRFQLDLADRSSRQHFGWRYHVVRYEELIASPERTLQRLMHSLDLEYLAEMLSFSDAAERLTSASDEAWKRETTGPLLSSNSGKWRDGLPGAQIKVTEAVLSRHMLRYGYKRSARREIVSSCYGVLYACASLFYRLRRQRSNSRLLREIGTEPAYG